MIKLGIDEQFVHILFSHYAACCKRYGDGGDSIKNTRCTVDQLLHHYGISRTPLSLYIFNQYNPKMNAFELDNWLPFDKFLMAMWDFLLLRPDLYDMVLNLNVDIAITLQSPHHTLSASQPRKPGR